MQQSGGVKEKLRVVEEFEDGEGQIEGGEGIQGC